MAISLPQPINRLDVHYKRFIAKDEQNGVYKIVYTSKGLENY